MSGPILLIIRFLLAAALYAFLGWALWTLWRDLRRGSEALVGPQAPLLSLILAGEEGDRPFRFTTPEVIIGRDPANDCPLEDKTISAQHARLSYHHGQWWVEDLGSRNGTFLNQEPVVEPLVVASGDRLRCGQVVLGISIGESDSGV